MCLYTASVWSCLCHTADCVMQNTLNVLTFYNHIAITHFLLAMHTYVFNLAVHNKCTHFYIYIRSCCVCMNGHYAQMYVCTDMDYFIKYVRTLTIYFHIILQTNSYHTTSMYNYA